MKCTNTQLMPIDTGLHVSRFRVSIDFERRRSCGGRLSFFAVSRVQIESIDDDNDDDDDESVG